MFGILFLLSLNTVKADISTIYYPYNSQVNITVPCINNNTICSATAKCNITILYNNDTALLLNTNMTNSAGFFSYGLNANQTGTKGIYKEYIICNDGSSNGYSATQFYITGKGTPPGSDSLVIFIYALFVVSVVALFILFFSILAKLIVMSVGVYDVLMSWAAYIVLMITFYLANVYLLSTFVENLSGTFLKILVFSNIIFPAIAYGFSFFFTQNTGVKK